MADSVSPQTTDFNPLLNYPTEEFPKRRWVNYRICQTLPNTIIDDPNDFDNLAAEYGRDSDFRLIFNSKPDGEKIIKMIVENKNLLLLTDFLGETVQFFRTPYNGSDTQPYQYMPMFNNYPTMLVEVKVCNVWVLIPGDYVKMDSQSLALLVDVTYQQDWAGDNWIGPGMCEKRLDANLKKIFIFRTDTVIRNNKQGPDSHATSPELNTLTRAVKFRDFVQAPTHFRSLLEPFRLVLVTRYSLDFWRKAVDPVFGVPTIFIDPSSPALPYYADLLETNKKLQDFQSQNHLKLQLVNNKRLKNNFSISIRDIAMVSEILGNVGKASADPKKIPANTPYAMTRK
jgi:vacuolar protein sorting-associated protein 13A/C